MLCFGNAVGKSPIHILSAHRQDQSEAEGPTGSTCYPALLIHSFLKHPDLSLYFPASSFAAAGALPARSGPLELCWALQ